MQLSFAVHESWARSPPTHELSITQVRLLGILRDREPAMLELARLLGLEKSSVTGLVDRAERRGLVERASAPHDGRAIHVRLTAKGRRLTERVAAQAYQTLAELLDALPARDRARLSTSLEPSSDTTPRGTSSTSTHSAPDAADPHPVAL